MIRTNSPEAIAAKKRCIELADALKVSLTIKGARFTDDLYCVNGQSVWVAFESEYNTDRWNLSATGRVRVRWEYRGRRINTVAGAKFDIGAFADKLIQYAAEQKVSDDRGKKLKAESKSRDKVAEKIQTTHGVDIEHRHGSYYLAEPLNENEANEVARFLANLRKNGGAS